MTESFLHYIWQHQLLGDGLTTIDGQPVVCHRAGELNRDSGPDFIGARLKIGDVEWVGNVEVHIHTSDWRAHKHSQDPAYNNLLLHVVYEHDCEVRQQDGKVPLTLELKPYLHPSLVANYDSLMAPEPESGIPCARQIAEVPRFIVDSALDRLTLERIEDKSATVRRMIDESHGNWEQTCYWLMARYFGGKVNALAFELLAKATDQRLLARWKDNPQRLEAMLMGQAGLLEGYFEDEYPRRMQSDYEALRNGTGLEPIGGQMWKFHRMRPSSFPTIRISQFAALVNRASNLFSTMLETTDVKQLEQLFDLQASKYWDNHYQFDKITKTATPKRMGRAQTQMLIINAWVPLLFVYGSMHGQQRYKDQAVALLEQLPPEDNVVVRRWCQVGMDPKSASSTQALLQLYAKYCNSRRCLECRIGYQILKHK
ncbi:MAG: DUF2851 family protein [Bacteroidales bacterium]|nr:DUF2851 family protein [Bacteroidales bacterium]